MGNKYAGGGGGAKKSKKQGLNLSPIELGKDVAGFAAGGLGALQQAVFRTGSGLGELTQGNIKGAASEIGHGLAELGTAGQIRGDINFEEATVPVSQRAAFRRGEVSSPLANVVGKDAAKVVGLGADIFLDPLLVGGAPRKARKGVKALSEIAGITEKEIAKGIAKKGLSEAEKASLVTHLVGQGLDPEAAIKIGKSTARAGGRGAAKTALGEAIQAKTGAVGKGIAAGPVGQAVSRATEAVRPGAELGRNLGDRKIAEEVRSLASRLSAEGATKVDNVMSEISNAAKATSERLGRQFDAADDAKVITALEGGPKGIAELVAKEPAYHPFLEAGDRIRHLLTDDQVKAGVLDTLLNTDNYMQRLASPEATTALGRAKRSVQSMAASDIATGLAGGAKQAAENARKIFPNFAAEDLNRLKVAADNGLDVGQAILTDPKLKKLVTGTDPDLFAKMVQDFEALAGSIPKGATIYKTSAIESLINRTASAYRAIAGKQFADELVKIKNSAGDAILISADDVANGAPVPHDWVDVEIPRVGKFKASKPLAEEINKVLRIAGRDEFTGEFDKAMSSWQQFWKAHATVGLTGSLPFAARNGRSNVWLMMTRGEMSPTQVPAAMKEAWNLETKVRKISGEARVGRKFVGEHAADVAARGLDDVMRDTLTKHEYEVWTEAQKRDVTRGFSDIEFGSTAEDVARKIRGESRGVKGGVAGHLLSPKGAVIRTGRDINGAVEQNARLALFMHVYDETGSFDEAEKVVKETLFDYQDLTAFEQKRLKWVAPFYTFMRKNLQAQAETLGKTPYRIALPENLMQAGTEGLPEGAPDYQKDRGARTVNALLPLFGGAVTTPDRPFGSAVENFAPLIQAAQGRGKEAARSAANIPGGAPLALLNALNEIGTGHSLFTAGKVPGGAGSNARIIAGALVPSLGRLPQVGPTTALTGKKAKPTEAELLRLLTGLRADKPKS